MQTEALFYLVVFLAILFVIFLLGREFICWYFKINENLKNQQRIILLLEGQGQASPGQSRGLPSGSVRNSLGGRLRYGDHTQVDLQSASGERWTFEGKAGDSVSIDLQVQGFKGYLTLFAPDDQHLRTESGIHSQIIGYRLPADGIYTIVVRADNPTATGSYSLTLTGSSPPGDPNR